MTQEDQNQHPSTDANSGSDRPLAAPDFQRNPSRALFLSIAIGLLAIVITSGVYILLSTGFTAAAYKAIKKSSDLTQPAQDTSVPATQRIPSMPGM